MLSLEVADVKAYLDCEPPLLYLASAICILNSDPGVLSSSKELPSPFWMLRVMKSYEVTDAV